MLNYEVSPDLLEPLVPAGVELDRWSGTLYVSVVGFVFRDTRVLGVPVPWHRTFEEVNLRFYVRRDVGGDSRRGVVFIREIVPRSAIAVVARLLYNEPYRALPMSRRLLRSSSDVADFEYAWRVAGEWSSIHARTAGSPRPLAVGSEEEFITEHYWGYSSLRGGGCVEYQVEHPRWRVWSLLRPVLDCDVAAL